MRQDGRHLASLIERLAGSVAQVTKNTSFFYQFIKVRDRSRDEEYKSNINRHNYIM